METTIYDRKGQMEELELSSTKLLTVLMNQ